MSLYFDENTLARLPRKRGTIQLIMDRLCFPLLCLLSAKHSTALGLTPIDEERLRYTLKELHGHVLDIGCGDNTLVRAYGDGVGVDVYAWPGVDVVVENAAALPFGDGEFDCVAMIASLNHIPNREDALAEAARVVRPGGKIILTMITPFVSWISHHVRYFYDPDQTERGMKSGEVWGLWKSQVDRMLYEAGFVGITSRSFLWGLNRIYVGYRASASIDSKNLTEHAQST